MVDPASGYSYGLTEQTADGTGTPAEATFQSQYQGEPNSANRDPNYQATQPNAHAQPSQPGSDPTAHPQPYQSGSEPIAQNNLPQPYANLPDYRPDLPVNPSFPEHSNLPAPIPTNPTHLPIPAGSAPQTAPPDYTLSPGAQPPNPVQHAGSADPNQSSAQNQGRYNAGASVHPSSIHSGPAPGFSGSRPGTENSTGLPGTPPPDASSGPSPATDSPPAEITIDNIKLFLKEWYATAKQVCTSPNYFFEHMPREGGLTAPTMFLAVSTAGAAFLQIIFSKEHDSTGALFNGIFNMFLFFIMARGVFYLMKRFNGKGTVESTYRVLCYGSPPLIITGLAWFAWLGLIYMAYLWFVGMKKVHELKT